MTSRHHLLADIENRRRKNAEKGVDVLSWELMPESDVQGYNPYDNPGAGKSTGPDDGPARRTRNRR